MNAMYHCADAKSAASLKRARPIRAIVGAIERGPIKRSTKPIKPENPRTTWTREATITAP